MAPLKPGTFSDREAQSCRFHGSDAVAPLKLVSLARASMRPERFHGSDAVAPLKQQPGAAIVVLVHQIPRHLSRGIRHCQMLGFNPHPPFRHVTISQYSCLTLPALAEGARSNPTMHETRSDPVAFMFARRWCFNGATASEPWNPRAGLLVRENLCHASMGPRHLSRGIRNGLSNATNNWLSLQWGHGI